MLRLKRTTSRRFGTHSRRWSSEKNLSDDRQQFHLLRKLRRLLLVAMLLANIITAVSVLLRMTRAILRRIGSGQYPILLAKPIVALDRLLLDMYRRWSRNSSLDE